MDAKETAPSQEWRPPRWVRWIDPDAVDLEPCPLSPAQAKALGEKLRTTMARPSARRILKGIVCSNGRNAGWTTGGCQILATVLQVWAGGNGHFVATGLHPPLHSAFDDPALPAEPCFMNHAAWLLGPWCFDGNGIMHLRDWAARWCPRTCVEQRVAEIQFLHPEEDFFRLTATDDLIRNALGWLPGWALWREPRRAKRPNAVTPRPTPSLPGDASRDPVVG